MSALSDLLAAKKDSVPKPQPEIPSKEAVDTSNQRTGMASTVNETSFAKSVPLISVADNEADPKKAAEAVEVYASNGRLRRTFLPGGVKFEAINGFFYVTTEAQDIVMKVHCARGEVRLVTPE